MSSCSVITQRLIQRQLKRAASRLTSPFRDILTGRSGRKCLKGRQSWEILDNVALSYRLDEYISDRIELSYTTFIGDKGNTKNIKLDKDVNVFGVLFRINADKDVPSIPLSLSDLHLKIRYQVGDIVEKECTCDSTYMLSAMRRVGTAMRTMFHWVSRSVPLYLIQDNAGGHGTDECVNEYKQFLLDDFNIILGLFYNYFLMIWGCFWNDFGII